MRYTTRTTITATALLLLGIVPAAFAQPFTLDKDLKAFQLTLRDYEGGNGVLWTAANGVAGSATEHLYVGGLSPQRAVEVYALSLSAKESVSLTLAKSYWNESLDSCTTDDSGMCGVRFTAQGDVGFKIDAAEGTSWQLVVMASPEIAMDAMLTSPLFEARRADAARYEAGAAAPGMATETESAGSNNWLAIAAVGLLAVIAVLLVLLLRRRGATTVVAAIAIVSGLLIPSAPPAFAVSESTAGTLDALGRELDQAQAHNAELDGIRNRLGSNADALLGRLKILMDLKNLVDEWNPLKACSIVANPPGTPRIPTFCEGDTACGSCYADARGEFNHVRGVFEQLRVIYKCSMDDINSAIAFGDSASGVHGVTGLAWQAEKAKIQKSVAGLKNAYDQKYAELRGRLHDSMIEIASCEARYGEPDWYDRFGYVYFEFISDKYKRAD